MKKQIGFAVYYGSKERMPGMMDEFPLVDTLFEANQLIAQHLEDEDRAAIGVRLITKPVGSNGAIDPLSQYGSVGVRYEVVTTVDAEPHQTGNLISVLYRPDGEADERQMRRITFTPPLPPGWRGQTLHVST